MFYNKYITNKVLDLGGQTTKILDKGSIELLGPFGLEKLLVLLSKMISGLNTSLVTTYALYILVGLIGYICLQFLPNMSLILFILLSLFLFLDNSQDR